MTEWGREAAPTGAAIVDGLDPREDELVLDRVRMSACSGTSLDVMLRNLGVTDVVVVGVWTNMAVEHTVRDAAWFRLFELVVHGRDLPEPVEPDHGALGLVVVAVAGALPAGLAVPPFVDGNGPSVDPLELLDLAAGRAPVPPGLGTVGEALPLLG